MALPDYEAYEYGTPIIWAEASSTASALGSGTNTLSFDALASGSARMGAAVDLGATNYDEAVVQLGIESGTAPTAGGLMDLYFAWSSISTSAGFPAGVTGSDGAWPSDGDEDQWAKQLGLPAISMAATNDGNTEQISNQFIIRVKGRYVAPVIDNNWDQAIRDQATASNNKSAILFIPRRRKIQDAA